MAFQANAKTWQVLPNETVLMDSGNGIHQQRLIGKTKNLMVTSFAVPWTVQLCSNAGITAGVNYGTTGTTDLWAIDNQTLTQSGGIITVANDVNFAAAATRHSWIVLRQTGIATNFEVCFDCLATGTGVSVIVSPAAGFTGGSVTARPTATDEKVVSTALFLLTVPNVTHRFHAWQSSDGQCNRIMVWNSGTLNPAWLQFDRIQNPVTGMTNPCVYTVLTSGNGVAAPFASITASTTYNMRGAGPANFQGSATFEAWNTNAALATANGIGTSPSTFDNSWPVMPMGLASNAAANSGRHGNMYDIWHAPTGIPDGNTFPDSCTARTHVKLAGFILPWTGDSTQPKVA